MRFVTIALIAVATAAPALASDDDFRDGRISYLEPGAVLQRSSESSAEEAVTNLPFLPGDRVWTDGGGRVEFQFADGTLLRLDSRSKLDYLAHDEDRGDRIVLRLWSGSAFLRTRNGNSTDFEIETPTAVVATRELGSFRIDAEPGETQLSVFDGSASLESGRRSVSVEAGERSWASAGDTPEAPRRFDQRAGDDFDRWNDDREDRTAWAGGSSQYLPDEIDPYASELESHGSWYYEAEVGHVWRPYVSPGWQPYSDGRWIWTSYGWTWIPNESWGWAPFHYGRWGHSTNVGWYWIPGRSWGPAWVSWAVGGDYVGWCPLGYRDRAVNVAFHQQRADLGHAVPRGSVGAAQGTSAWVYARRADLASRDLAKRRVANPRPELIKDVRIVDSAHARPSRDLRVVEPVTPGRREGAVPRSVKVKPTPGDTVPELRGDRTTTIPTPGLRRPRPSDDPRYDGGAAPRDGERGVPRAEPRDRTTSRDAGTPRDGASGAGERRIWDGRSTSERSGSEAARQREAEAQRDRSREIWRPRAPDPAPRSRETERVPETSRERPPTSRPQPDRDVLRPIFRPLSEPRQSQPRSVEPRSVPRSEPRVASPPRSEPRQAQPPPPDRQNHQAPRPPKDRDHH